MAKKSKIIYSVWNKTVKCCPHLNKKLKKKMIYILFLEFEYYIIDQSQLFSAILQSDMAEIPDIPLIIATSAIYFSVFPEMCFSLVGLYFHSTCVTCRRCGIRYDKLLSESTNNRIFKVTYQTLFYKLLDLPCAI